MRILFYKVFTIACLGRVPGPDPRGHLQLSQLGQPESGRLEVCHRLGRPAGSSGQADFMR
jgi:hypothetical protein